MENEGFCGRQFGTLGSLRDHMNSKGHYIRCCCSRMFKDMASLEQHQRDYHKGRLKPYKQHRAFDKHQNNSDLLQEHLGASRNYEDYGSSSTTTTPIQNIAAAFEPLILPVVDTLPYSGLPSRKVRVVFQAACAFRHRDPKVEDIIQATGTDVDQEVVSAILEGALRLLPPDRSEEGDSMRREKEATKAAHADAAEKSFVEAIRAWHRAGMRDEIQQKDDIRQAMENGTENTIKLTPDIIFDTPAEFEGEPIFWMEFKNTFGFRKNPFIHGKHIKQVKRYRAALGPGIIVYKLGYEQSLFQIEGVECLREADVLSAIDERADL